MAADPVFLAGFRIGEAAAGQYSDKQICLGYLTGNGIMDIQRRSGPVYFHGISGLVLNPHGGLGYAGSLTVLLAVLGVHVRNDECLYTYWLRQGSRINGKSHTTHTCFRSTISLSLLHHYYTICP